MPDVATVSRPFVLKGTRNGDTDISIADDPDGISYTGTLQRSGLGE